MATLPNTEELWTVREYLRTSWSPDREFVDGHIEERNLDEKEHSIIQGYLTFLFNLKRQEWEVRVFPELRTQTQARRFRVPDVLVVRSGQKFDRYVTQPPLIAIEILSPEDTLTAMRAKAACAQTPSATFLKGKMLHGEELQASVVGRAGLVADAVGAGLESGGYTRRTPAGALHHHPRDGA